MFWIFMALLALVAGIGVARRTRSYESVEEEPWRASLEEDEPLDVEEARRAEEEFLSESEAEGEDEPWD